MGKPKILLTRADLDLKEEGVSTKQTSARTEEVDAQFVLPDLVADIQVQTNLSRSTVASILLKCGRLQDAMNNPQAFIEETADLINRVRRDLMVQGVEYFELAGQHFEMPRFEDDDLMELFEANLFAVSDTDKTLFTHLQIDGGSGPEKDFAADCDANDDCCST